MVEKVESDGVGAYGRDFRLLRAKEAVRQGELQLAGDKESVVALEARATAMLGWLSAATVAAAVWMGTSGHWHHALWSLLPLGVSAIAAVTALWPSRWFYAGYSWGKLSAMPVDTELGLFEGVAFGYARDHGENLAAIRRKAYALRAAWSALLIAIAVAVGGSVVSLPLFAPEAASRRDSSAPGRAP